ncbi:hypothetical protein B0H11DRAFT_1910813 [Mycena galericulata]|nr:hypothetical protein B0H11DRAFT_1910813 [Mycena galericulata]
MRCLGYGTASNTYLLQMLGCFVMLYFSILAKLNASEKERLAVSVIMIAQQSYPSWGLKEALMRLDPLITTRKETRDSTLYSTRTVVKANLSYVPDLSIVRKGKSLRLQFRSLGGREIAQVSGVDSMNARRPSWASSRNEPLTGSGRERLRYGCTYIFDAPNGPGLQCTARRDLILSGKFDISNGSSDLAAEDIGVVERRSNRIHENEVHGKKRRQFDYLESVTGDDTNWFCARKKEALWEHDERQTTQFEIRKLEQDVKTMPAGGEHFSKPGYQAEALEKQFQSKGTREAVINSMRRPNWARFWVLVHDSGTPGDL